jgi:hypothetical protein
VAGRTPHAAVSDFRDSMQKAISCVTDAVLRPGHRGYEPSGTRELTFRDDSIPLPGEERLSLSVRHFYRVDEQGQGRERWKVSTVAYYYELRNQHDEEIISYHWHPESRSPVIFPHMHIGKGAGVEFDALLKAYFPTPRILLEDFLRLLIEDLGVPNQGDWKTTLAETREKFEADSTWGSPSYHAPENLGRGRS